jgi:3-methyladenine DNA glycosylase/8-oxoguanine DNA glycosylase
VNQAVAGQRGGVTAAARALAELDPVMGRLVDQHGPPTELARRSRRRIPTAGRFEELTESIAYQQLAGAAAEAIWRRVKAGVGEPFPAEAVLAAGPDRLRAAGFSAAKTASVLDLADKVSSGQVRLARIGRLADADVVAELVQVRGIGRWTAEMFLIFSLGRLDVWPVTDYGVRAGFASAYGLAALPSPGELDAVGERFRPYRTLAAWYCWREVVQSRVRA